MRTPRLPLGTALLLLALVGCASPPGRNSGSEQDPAFLNAQLGLGYLRQGNHEVALDKLKRALEHDSRQPDANHYIAVLYQRLGETKQADRHFRTALSVSDDNTSLYNNYGVFLCDEGRFKEAERYFLKVLEDPLYARPADVKENIGLCAYRDGDLPKAEKYLHEALEMDARRPAVLLGMAQIAFAQEQYPRAHSYLRDHLELARHTPESLWLGVQLARELGKRDEFASYSLLLKAQYPDSPEASLLKDLESKRANR